MFGISVLEWLSKHRDGFLVAGAGIYGLGYLVWSVNALKHGLGQLPALEFQYFAAGLVPALIIGVASAAFAFFYRIQENMESFATRHPWLHFFIAMLPLLASFILLVVSQHQGWIQEWTFAMLFTILVYLVFTLVPPSYVSDEWIIRRVTPVYRYVVPILFIGVSLALYGGLYQQLPQELGGPKPKCVHVDLVRAETSASTLATLAEPGDSTDSPDVGTKVVASKKLHVYFSNNDYLLVRVAPPNDAAISSSSSPLYELRKEVFRIVRRCE
jgi:hypothetical protein